MDVLSNRKLQSIKD